MKIVDRLILAIFSISIAILSLIIMILPFNFGGIINIRDGVNLVYAMKGNYMYSLIALIFFIVSLRFLLSGIMGNKESKQESFLIMQNEYGEVIIYAHTIVGLVDNIGAGFTGINNIDYDNYSSVLTSMDPITYFKHVCDNLRYNILYDADANQYKIIIF